MKALMVPFGFGYGTAARNLAVAAELRRRGHEAVFAAGAALESLLSQYGFETRVVTDIKLQNDSWLTPEEQAFWLQAQDLFLERLLRDLRQAIRDYRVDILVHSNNNMATLAAGAEDIPSVSIFHPSIVQMRSIKMFHGTYLKWRTWGDLVKATKPVRKVVSGLFGDLNYIPSLPQFIKWPPLLSPEIFQNRQKGVPVGALVPEPVDELPSREQTRSEYGIADEPFIYATLGGAVRKRDFLKDIVAAFSGTAYRVLITAGAAAAEDEAKAMSTDRVTVLKYVPQAIRLIKACEVIIWHGGHETMMEAVACGRPAVAVPQQFDQETNSKLFAQTGAGIMIPRRRLAPEALVLAVDEILDNPRYYCEAAALQRQSEALGGVRRVVNEMEGIVVTG